MTKITKTARKTIRSILIESREYDASTMRISRDGEVSAKKDANKTFGGRENTRYLVGYASDMVDADGNKRSGY